MSTIGDGVCIQMTGVFDVLDTSNVLFRKLFVEGIVGQNVLPSNYWNVSPWVLPILPI